MKNLLRQKLTVEDLLSQLSMGKVLVVSFIGGLLAVAIEPDHTSKLPIVTSYSLWASHIFLISGLFLALLQLLSRLIENTLVILSVSILPLPFVFAPLSIFLDYGLGIPDEELTSSSGPLHLYLSETLAVAPLTYAVAALFLFTCLQFGTRPQNDDLETAPISRSDKGQQEKIQSDPLPQLQALIPSIPHDLGQDIIRMHAQDHYVEITTSQGRTLLSEQFGACVEKLAPLPGLQCHRSHWISLAHVVSFTRAGSAYLCNLSNGDQVPVSRRRYQELKELSKNRQGQST